ncbi:rhodanese-like domain-containing protein [Leucothrix arctica]|uniref:Rhodanese-like domain-containing protein n=1 Tax=Leucothrix arctica TaxID=1481894 RepID=A0A317CKP0_9GAMM|nr:rhodanese-like domain-containing protein [Leucothrix arctica]PWQ98757.1 rhodanese-like domain-containing protein [Leucothrix arctica]
MQEYTAFFQNNLILFLGFFAVLAVIIWTEKTRMSRKYHLASINEAVKLMNDDSTIIVDVREDREIKDAVISGSTHIPMTEFATRHSELVKFKSAPIVVYCSSGNRSGGACNTLTKEGFENVHSLVGGMAAWEKASLPVTRR